MCYPFLAKRGKGEGLSEKEKNAPLFIMDKDEIARRIMNYLRKHPDARDTLEGIAKWWLGFEKIDESVKDVSIVIEGLKKKALLKKRSFKAGRHIIR